MKKKLLLTVLLGSMALGYASAQRPTDILDRGLVAVPSANGGILCTWRLPAEEYYDVAYNIYRDGTKLNDAPLSAANFNDPSGSTSSSYQVEAIVRGVAQPKSAAVKPWSKHYLEINPDKGDFQSRYEPNDATFADVDGDGQLELLIKMINKDDRFTKAGGIGGEFDYIGCFKLDGTRLWWIDMGPNMSDFQHNETNIAAFDWDGDGRAECVLRAADGTTIHMADGTTQVIGDKSKNYRPDNPPSGQYFIHEGDEFLLYLDGLTGKPYYVGEYPLRRLEPGETDLNAAWGDGYGHRSSKHFFGAPFLDGRKPSIFLARGIYTRHKMVAFDVDPATHQLTERWRWNSIGGAWHGQGYHNYGVADVDLDGRDEIVYGSMVIDDNGRGLSTTGLGHGDSQHCSDFDPYIHGLEIWACNEDRPNNNFRDATTSKIYYRTTGGSDDGRAIMGNFSNQYPGAQGSSARDYANAISSVSHDHLPMGTDGMAQNFRIKWDGDLLDETFNYSNGKNTAGGIYKHGNGTVAILEGSMTNNDTKGTPCFQGDILGDWREEVVMRTADDKIRIYTTNIPTTWRETSLWYDHQYRNAMVWQMCGYNQTPHHSFFLGDLEGMTVSPAPLTNVGREEVQAGATIGSGHNDKHVMFAAQADASLSVAAGAAPYIFTDNAPSWVQGNNDNDNISYTYYTHTLTGAGFSGSMRLVKQGDGTLVLPAVAQSYTGSTDVWGGTLRFDGTMEKSPVWLNLHTTLVSDGGKFPAGITALYGASIAPGGKGKVGTMEVGTLDLGFGSSLEIDIESTSSLDNINVATLKIGTVDWEFGPEFSAPKIAINASGKLAAGKYVIGTVGKVEGKVSDLQVVGLAGTKAALANEDGKLVLVVADTRDAAQVSWSGAAGSTWDNATTANFSLNGSSDVFVGGDQVVFDDNAANTAVTIAEEVQPQSVVFRNHSKDYTFEGAAIAGPASLTMEGSAKVTLNNTNTFTGGTFINNGTLAVSALANNDGTETGSLGGVDAPISIGNGGTLASTGTVNSAQPLKLAGEATIDVPSRATFTLSGAVTKTGTTSLVKDGAGSLDMQSRVNADTVVVKGGTAIFSDDTQPANIVARGKNVTISDHDNMYSYNSNAANYIIEEGSTATLNTDSRCTYTGRLFGKGELTVNARGVRSDFTGDWSEFEGTLHVRNVKSTYDGEFRFNNSYGLGKATVEIPAGVSMYSHVNGSGDVANNSFAFGNLTGAGTIATGGTITVGARNEDITFKGSFKGNNGRNPALVKVGDGTWTVSDDIAIRSLRVEGGTMAFARDYHYMKTPIVPGNIDIIGEGSTLFAAGLIESARATEGATVYAGRHDEGEEFECSSGALKATASVSIDASSHLIVFASGVEEDYRSWLIAKFLTIDGDVTLRIAPEYYTPALGDELVVWDVENLAGTPKAVNLPALPEELAWDTTDLMQNRGVVRVVKNAGINDIPADSQVAADVYNLVGIKLGTVTTSRLTVADDLRSLGLDGGIYIVRTGDTSIKVAL